MPPTLASRVGWLFRNVTQGYDFWPLLDSISISDSHPIEQATFECDVEDPTASLVFEEDDVIRVTHDDGSGPVKVHEGLLAVITWRDHGRTGPRVWGLHLTDYTPMLGWDVVKSSGTRRAESASDRLTWLMSLHTHGITIASATLPGTTVEAADFLGQSVMDGIEQLCQDLALSYYVDFDKGLHIFTTDVVTAPFGIVAAGADMSSTHPFWDWSHERDVTEQMTKALVIGDKSYALIADSAAVAAYGVKEGVVQDAAVRGTAAMARAGARALANDAYPAIEGRGTVAVYGLRAGMTVEVAHHLWPDVEAEGPYIITSIEIRAVDPHDDAGTAQLRCDITYSDRRRHKARGRNKGGGDSDTEEPSGGAVTMTPHEMEYLFDNFELDPVLSLQYHTPAIIQISRGIFHNLPYTTTGCPLGFGGWAGAAIEEAWYEYSASIGDDTTGMRITIPAITTSLIHGPIATAGPYRYGYKSGAPDDVGQGVTLGHLPAAWPVSGVTVDLPRHAITGHFFIAADWPSLAAPESGGDGFFCAGELIDGLHGPMGASTSGGEGGSGRVRAPACTAVLLAGRPAVGLTPWMSGIGDIDGSNRTFDLPDWDGSGVPKVKVNGLILDSRDYTWDGDAGTVTLRTAPTGPSDIEAGGDSVMFRYRVSR